MTQRRLHDGLQREETVAMMCEGEEEEGGYYAFDDERGK